MNARFAMFDSVDVATLPRGAGPFAIGGYVGGHWPTWGEVVRLFPNHPKLSIAVNASEDADGLDIEAGDATPEEAPPWVRRQHARGVARPTLYCNLSTLPAVLAALQRAGIPRQSVWLWVAHPNGVPHVCGPTCTRPYGVVEHADATQFDWTAFGRNLDESLCEPWFLSHPKPTPAKPKDPLWFLVPDEKHWVQVFDELQVIKRHRPLHPYGLRKEAHMVRLMAARRKRIWKLAEADRFRWGVLHRGVRYQALKRRTPPAAKLPELKGRL